MQATSTSEPFYCVNCANHSERFGHSCTHGMPIDLVTGKPAADPEMRCHEQRMPHGKCGPTGSHFAPINTVDRNAGSESKASSLNAIFSLQGSYSMQTEQFAEHNNVSRTSVVHQLFVSGSYFGVTPHTLPNGRLVWPAVRVNAGDAS